MLTIDTWESLSDLGETSTQLTHGIGCSIKKGYCFKLLSFRMICYAAKASCYIVLVPGEQAVSLRGPGEVCFS